MQGLTLWIMITAAIILAAKAVLRHIDRLDYEAGIVREKRPALSVRAYRRLKAAILKKKIRKKSQK